MSTVHRFSAFEIDEAKRELRAADGRVLPLQPRVFDLLVYLVKNGERVVPKDELLDAVWPGVIVTDASLQRAVSLARGALAEAGAADAIRTFSRQGYRFCLDAAACAKPSKPARDDPTSTALARARAAYERGDWEAAIAALRKVDDVEGLSGEDLQRWAHAAQCAGRPSEAVPPLERAVAAFTARGDQRGAAWAAILLAQLRVEWREPVLAKGWFHRAARLLAGLPPCREQGYLDFLGARMALMQNELETSLELAKRAQEAGVQFSDPDLEGLGLVHVGEASLYLGQIREGLAAIDEAGVSVVANGLSPWAGGLVYCGVIYSCMTRADWRRAGQWTEQFTRWCEGKGTAGYPGLCRMHRAEVLTVRGDLDEAEREIRATIDMLAKQAPWAEGDAWRALGEVLLSKGDNDGARAAFQHAHEIGWESQTGLAMVRFAEGDAAGAARMLARALAENIWSARSQRGQTLAQFAIVAVAANKVDDARAALAEIDREPELTSTPALQALVSRARAELAAAEGRHDEAVTLIRAALRAWQSLEAPLAVAQARCRLSDFLAAEGDSEAARLELAAAVTTFQQAGATGLLANCERLKRSLDLLGVGPMGEAPRKRRSR